MHFNVFVIAFCITLCNIIYIYDTQICDIISVILSINYCFIIASLCPPTPRGHNGNWKKELLGGVDGSLN